MMETQARDGSGVAGMSRSVPSSPGERSPSDKFNPGEELGNSSEVSQPAEVPGFSAGGSSSQTTNLTVSRSILYRQTTLESPCYQPSPHHRHPYQAVSPPSSPAPRAVTFSQARPQEIVPRVEILEISPSPSLTSDCSAHTP